MTEKPRILLVDDDVTVIHVLAKVLGDHGMLSFARSGEEALRSAAERRPNLVLLDAGLPGIDGFEVCRRLKADPTLSDVPIIFVTASNDPAAERLAFELGASDFLCKPLVSAQVIARVRTTLRSTSMPGLGLHASLAPVPSAHVLIVDDDPTTVRVMHNVLSDLGVLFRFATSAESAIEMVDAFPPDLILLDLQMPGTDGFEVFRRLREKPVAAHVPVVFITCDSNPENEARALDLGGSDFVSKPYSSTVLQARIRNVLRSKQRSELAAKLEREHWQRVGDERVARIVEQSSDGFVSIDRTGHVVLINSAACRLLGRPIDELLGHAARDVIPASIRLEDAARSSAPMRVMWGAGGDAACALEVSVSHSGADDERLTTLVMRDLTERERTEQAMREKLAAETSSRTKTFMLSSMAHEITNPLSAILAYVQLMEKDKLHTLPRPQAERLHHIAACVERMRLLMRDVLDINRFETGQFAFSPAHVDASVIVRAALDDAHAEAVRKQVELEGAADLPPCWVSADAGRLAQCVANLVGNAIKYNRAGGKVCVQITAGAREARIAVRDTGLGLSEEEIAQLFQPFHRLGRGGPGEGIGLVLTRLLVMGMGGTIEVESRPGHGSCFTLVLPSSIVAEEGSVRSSVRH